MNHKNILLFITKHFNFYRYDLSNNTSVKIDVPKMFTGGGPNNYYNKYLKYKRKYTMMKKSIFSLSL